MSERLYGAVAVLTLLPALRLPAQQPAGVTPEWDTRTMLLTLASEVKRLKPILDQVKPKDWVAKGAPDAYIRQWQGVQNEVDYLVGATQNLSNQPEKLTLALEALFRLQAVEAFAQSLAGGIRKYQNPALADLLVGILTENSGSRERLKQYITDLAATKEHEFQVADREAQRCRSVLSRQPAAPSGAKPEPRREQK